MYAESKIISDIIILSNDLNSMPKNHKTNSVYRKNKQKLIFDHTISQPLQLTHQSPNCHRARAYHTLGISKLASSHSSVEKDEHRSTENVNRLLDDMV